MVSDQQVRRLRQKLMEEKSQEAAAAAAGMSVRTARTWQTGPLPSEKKRDRNWRTRRDPFGDVWASDIEPLLWSDVDGALQATTILEVLEERYPGRFGRSHLRTLQRRMRDWRALNGPDREVFFPQEHPPGREAQLDFTHADELGVSIGGEPFPHLLFEFVLSHSGWRFVDIVPGETFEALVQGLQGALWELGGVPEVVRTDNLSAATHDLGQARGRALNERFRSVLEHYGLRATRTNARASHENGVVEQAHNRVKQALDQALRLRGSRDFASRGAYRTFIRGIVRKLNGRSKPKFAQERHRLRPLPTSAVPEYSVYRTKVRKWSTIRVGGKSYTVPSRLIGHEVEARLYPDVVEVHYRGRLVERMPRLRGSQGTQVNYRHVIWSLARKPGAFARYRFRESLFPTPTFRRAYEALQKQRGERADVDYVRILRLAASTMESDVERALGLLLENGETFDYAAVQELAAPVKPSPPEMTRLSVPDLRVYDSLLQGVM